MEIEKRNKEIKRNAPLSNVKSENVKRKLNINTITPIFKSKNGVIMESPTKVLY